jgi:hypothetical protein
MPTAILMAYTRDGFFAVSDGKGTNGTTDSQHERKIFVAKGPSLKVMYGVSGIASILDRGVEILQPIYRPIIEELATQRWPNLGTYADTVMLKLRSILCAEIRKAKNLPDSCIAPPYSFKIQFAGYCNEKPVMTVRELNLWSDKWCVTTSEPLCVAYPGNHSFVGSDAIRKKLVDIEDEEFSDFKTSGFLKLIKQDGNMSRDEFIEGAKRYIQACMTQQARKLDPCCESIGGDIWSAALLENGDLSLCVIVPFNTRESTI